MDLKRIWSCNIVGWCKHWLYQKWKISCWVKHLAQNSFPIFCQQRDCLIFLLITAAILCTQTPFRPWPMTEWPQWRLLSLSLLVWPCPVLSSLGTQHLLIQASHHARKQLISSLMSWLALQRCVFPPAYMKSCKMHMQSLFMIMNQTHTPYVFLRLQRQYVVLCQYCLYCSVHPTYSILIFVCSV